MSIKPIIKSLITAGLKKEANKITTILGKVGELGSISHATHRNEDLIPVFIETLERLDTDKKYSDTIKEGKEIIDKEDWDSENTDDFLNEDLFEALNDFAPPNAYFGAHPGDGSDFGFWEYEPDEYEDDE